MGRPAKSLAEHVHDDSFRARRHHGLLTGPALPWPALAVLQAQYRAATRAGERRAIALEFEHAVKIVHARAKERVSEPVLDAVLDELGPAGSLERLCARPPPARLRPDRLQESPHRPPRRNPTGIGP